MLCKSCGKELSDKKKKVIIISFSVVVFLLVITGILYIFRASILMSIAPKEYAAYCMGQTATQLKDDSTELLDMLLGFELKSDTDFTFTNRIEMDGAKIPYESIEVAYIPSQGGISARAQGVELYGKKADTSILWDDRIIGISVNQLSEEQYYAVSSKNFGKQLSDTKLPVSEDIKNDKRLADIDLSFSNVCGSNKENFESLQEALTDETLVLLEKGTVKYSGTGKQMVNSTEKNVHILNLSFEGSDIKEYLINCMMIASNDSEFKSRFGENALYYMEEAVKQRDYNFKADISISLYDDRVVFLSYKESAGKLFLSFGFDSTEFLPDGFEICYHFENKVFEMKAKGNIKPWDNKTDYTLSINSNDAYTYIDMNLDFTENKANIAMEFPSSGKAELEGTCRMGDGFELDVKGKDSSIELAVARGGNLCKLSGEEYMLLEKSTSSLVWNFGKILFESPKAREIIYGFTKEFFSDNNILDNLMNQSSGLGALFGR